MRPTAKKPKSKISEYSPILSRVFNILTSSGCLFVTFFKLYYNSLGYWVTKNRRPADTTESEPYTANTRQR